MSAHGLSCHARVVADGHRKRRRLRLLVSVLVEQVTHSAEVRSVGADGLAHGGVQRFGAEGVQVAQQLGDGEAERAYHRTGDGGKTFRRRDTKDWAACIPNAHPGYITWDRYQENLRLLASNGHGYDVARASPPREGPALLQGRAVHLALPLAPAELRHPETVGIDITGEPLPDRVVGVDPAPPNPVERARPTAWDGIDPPAPDR